MLGEGFYIFEHVKHAETLALEQAGVRAAGATAYVSLEPHNHTGRTPPCTNALINAGIKRVVAPGEDPNPLVSGKGFRRLQAAGVEVSVGMLADEAARLNEKYIHFMRRARPFVHLKLAASLDGKIATRTGDARWITGEPSRARVHHLRHEYDAILVGAGTVTKDDPLLTDRSQQPRRRPLARIVLDRRLELRADAQLARTARDAPVIVFTAKDVERQKVAALEACGVEIIRAPAGADNLVAVLDELARRSFISLLVEGGSRVAGAFVDAGLVNKLSFFIAPLIIGGTDAPSAIGGDGAATISQAVKLRDPQVTTHGRDIEVTGYPEGEDAGS